MTIKTQLLTLLFLSITALTMEGCSTAERTADKEATKESSERTVLELTERQMQTVGITVSEVEERRLNSVINTRGELKLSPQDRAEVTSLIGGVIRSILVREGDQVTRGQAIATLENREIVELQKNYLVTTKQMELAKQEMERQESLSKTGAGVEKLLQQATTSYATLQAEMVGLQQQLKQLGLRTEDILLGKLSNTLTLRAPISGIVRQVTMSNGSYLDTSTPLVQILDNRALYAELSVFEKDLPLLKKEQSVSLTLTNHPATRLDATISHIGGYIDDASRTLTLQARLSPHSTATLLEGMAVTGLIHVGEQATPALPDGAIVSSEGRQFVFVQTGKQIENGEVTYHFEQSEVVTGVSELGYTAVSFVDPLPEGAPVVTKNAFYLASMSADHGEH